MEYFQVIEACIGVPSFYDDIAESSTCSLDEALFTVNYSLSSLRHCTNNCDGFSF